MSAHVHLLYSALILLGACSRPASYDAHDASPRTLPPATSSTSDATEPKARPGVHSAQAPLAALKGEHPTNPNDRGFDVYKTAPCPGFIRGTRGDYGFVVVGNYVRWTYYFDGETLIGAEERAPGEGDVILRSFGQIPEAAPVVSERTCTPNPTEVSVMAPKLSRPIAEGQRAIMGLRGRFRTCYQGALAKNPGMEGKGTFGATVNDKGEVESTKTISGKGLAPELTECIGGALRGLQFTSGPSNIEVTIVFSLKKP